MSLLISDYCLSFYFIYKFVIYTYIKILSPGSSINLLSSISSIKAMQLERALSRELFTVD